MRGAARGRLLAVLALLLALLAGCAVQTETLRRAPPAGLVPKVELSATPFFAQTEYHCGPAGGPARQRRPLHSASRSSCRHAPAPCRSR
jgi:hypothetical protein